MTNIYANMPLNENEPQIGPQHLVESHHWVSRHADYLYTYALVRVNDREQAKDLVQATFLAALEKVPDFKGNSSERTWLTSILKYKIIDIYRKKSGQVFVSIDVVVKEYFESDDGQWLKDQVPFLIGIEGHDALENKEIQRAITVCLDKLPVLWSSIFKMKYMDDESTEFICSSLGISPGNFWVITHRAKVSLRACIQKNWNK